MKFKAFIRKAAAVVTGAAMLLSLSTAAFASDYENHWANRKISILLEEEIISGYENGDVRPNNYITRAEFITLVNKMFNYIDESDENFADVDLSKWYAPQMAIAKNYGYISGDTNGNSNPERNITRTEVCVIIANCLGLDLDEEETGFTDDASISPWAKKYIRAMADLTFISGYPDGSFGEKKPITRAEGFTIVYNVLCSDVFIEYMENYNYENDFHFDNEDSDWDDNSEGEYLDNSQYQDQVDHSAYYEKIRRLQEQARAEQEANSDSYSDDTDDNYDDSYDDEEEENEEENDEVIDGGEADDDDDDYYDEEDNSDDEVYDTEETEDDSSEEDYVEEEEIDEEEIVEGEEEIVDGSDSVILDGDFIIY